jgi:hypothetical protein
MSISLLEPQSFLLLGNRPLYFSYRPNDISGRHKQKYECQIVEFYERRMSAQGLLDIFHIMSLLGPVYGANYGGPQEHFPSCGTGNNRGGTWRPLHFGRLDNFPECIILYKAYCQLNRERDCPARPTRAYYWLRLIPSFIHRRCRRCQFFVRKSELK